mgnify:CR=1 FL=1
MFNLYDIKDPSFLKELTVEELQQLADDIRHFLIQTLSKTGGHVAPNLGVVELTIAMHRAFNSPQDKLIFDVGHQVYTHKILTGRAKYFDTLRQYNGLSGFPKRSESEHDLWETGHSSTSISAAAGFVYARDYLKEDYHVVGLIGDGALTGGMAFEALNHLGQTGKRVIIILNDNEMSISQNVGAFTNILIKLRLNKRYNKAKKLSTYLLKKDRSLTRLVKRAHAGIKHFFLQSNIFEEIGFEYFGPIDGHNIGTLIKAFEVSKTFDKPVLLHVVTQKGKGYEPAENDTVGIWHGCGPFDIETGQFLGKKKENTWSWSKIISEIVTELARKDERIFAITPAMKNGSELGGFEKAFPDRFIDVGIAEQHALTFAGGLSAQGMRPFVAIYSTFLQRAYDQLNHDLARQNLPVVIGVDRSGIVGGDGDTHQGIYDIALTRHIPNVSIMMPKDPEEAYDMLYTAFNKQQVSLIRYPRGGTEVNDLLSYEPKEIEYGTWTQKRYGDELFIISYGPTVLEVEQIVVKHSIPATIVNARFIKPLDTQMIDRMVKENKPVIVYEEASQIGSLNSAILEYLQQSNQTCEIYSIGIPDEYVPQGDRKKILKDLNMDEASLIERIQQIVRVEHIEQKVR